ncbi:MAG: hypothetical protein H6732_11170 [Alphaproteobacteria bacterium]|nr:hypothetical protein [Alphaproteobacteria bacterium]
MRWALRLLVAALLLEGLVRVLVVLPPVRDRLWGPEGGELRPRLALACAGLGDDWEYLEHDPALGWQPRRAWQKTTLWGEVGHDATGARLVPGTATEGTRVVLLGDSFTYGADVGNGETWAARLAARRPDLAVTNLGVPGFSLEQILLRWRRDGRPLQPDVVVLGFVESDIDRTGHGHYGRDKPWATLADDGLAWHGQPVPSPEEACRARRLQPWTLLLGRWLVQGTPFAQTTRSERLAVSAAVVETLWREVEATGATFVLLHLPMDSELGLPGAPTRPPVRLQAWAEEHGVPFADPTPALKAALARGVALEKGQHYAPEANDLVAAALAEALPAAAP